MLDVIRLGNQGRFVRPGAARLWGGLLFATASEAAVARALDALGVAFFPLAPGRVTGEGGLRVTRELDFLVVHQRGPIAVRTPHPHCRPAGTDP